MKVIRGKFLRELIARDFLLLNSGIENWRSIFVDSDIVRNAAILLILNRIKKEKIPGEMAEGGVYRGARSRFIHKNLPKKKLFLFDTFEGFPPKDIESMDSEIIEDRRFRDTTMESVRKSFGVISENIIIKKGYFPESAVGITENFSFVLLDFDKFKPTLAGLRFFQPIMSEGGYIMLHDFNSGESNYAVQRAVKEFILECPSFSSYTELPDCRGSIIYRKAYM